MGMHRYTVVFDYTKSYKEKCANPECDVVFDKLSNRTKRFCSKRCSQYVRRRIAGVKPLASAMNTRRDPYDNYSRLRHRNWRSWVKEWNAEHPRPVDDKVIATETCSRFEPSI